MILNVELGSTPTNPTDGSVVETIITDNIGTLAHRNKNEKTSHGYLERQKDASKRVLQRAQNLTNSRRNKVKGHGKVCKSFKL